MNHNFALGVAAFAVLISASLSNGQDAASTTAQRAAMKKLDVWVGEWKGTGWIRMGPQKNDFTITETIQSKLDGLALHIEGLGKANEAASGREVTTHNAIGVITYDDKAKRYRFWHFKAGDVPGEAELKVIDGGFEWERRTDRGTARFTSKVDGDNWQEVGEASNDGKTWVKFMEMRLQRQKPAAPGKP